jgi:hypothetical protein
METTGEYLKRQQRYSSIREVPGHGWCCIQQNVFTTYLCYGYAPFTDSGIECWEFKGYYVYESFYEATIAMHVWDGSGLAPYGWIKRVEGNTDEIENPEIKKKTEA